MATPNLQFAIQAVNQTKGVFRNLRSSIGSLSQNADSAEESFRGVTAEASSIADQVFKANLATEAFKFGLGKVQQAIGFVSSKFTEATDLQLELVSATNSFKSVAGLGYDESKQIMEDLNNQLAISAATLPGVTQEYKTLAQSISDNLVGAYKDADGNLDVEKWTEATKSISESYGALTAASTKDIGNTMQALNKAMAGASEAELKSYAFFEQNQSVINEIGKRLDEAGAETLKDLELGERIKLIEEAGAKFIDEDFRREAGSTVEGLTQGFTSALFDPSSGIFGVMRDLNDSLKGTQSVFSAYNDALKILIGNESILERFKEVASNLGLAFDPMVAVQGMIEYVNTRLEAVRGFLESISHTTNRTVVLQKALNALLRDAIPYVVNQVSYFIIDLMDGVSRFFGDVIEAFQSQSFGDVFATLSDASGELLSNIDFSAVATAATGLISAVFLGIAAQGIGGVIFASFIGIFKTVLIAPIGGAIAAVGTAVAGAMSGVLVPVLVIGGIIATVVAALSFNTDKISGYLEAFKARLEDFLGFSLNLKAIGDRLGSILSDIGMVVANAVDRFIDAIDFGQVASNAAGTIGILIEGIRTGFIGVIRLATRALLNLDLDPIFSRFSEIASGLVKIIGQIISDNLPRLINLSTKALHVIGEFAIVAAFKIGELIGRLLIALPWGEIANQGFNIIKSLILNLDWGSFIGAAFKVVLAGASALGAKALAAMAVGKITAIFTSLLIVPLKGFLVATLMPAVVAVLGALKAVIAAALLPVVSTIGAALAAVAAPVLAAIAVGALLLAGFAAVFKLAGGDFGKLKLLFTTSLSEWKTVVKNLLSSVLNKLQPIFDLVFSVFESISNLVSAIVPDPIEDMIMGAIKALGNRIKSLLDRINPFSASDVHKTKFTKSNSDAFADSIDSSISSVEASAVQGNSLRIASSPTVVQSASPSTSNSNANESKSNSEEPSTSGYRGFIPAANQGFIQSLIRAGSKESRNKPPGSSLVVANSSEAILNRDQMGVLSNILSLSRSDRTPAIPAPDRMSALVDRTPASSFAPAAPATPAPAPNRTGTLGALSDRLSRSDRVATPPTPNQTINITVNVPATNSTTSPEFVDEMVRQLNVRLRQYRAGILG